MTEEQWLKIKAEKFDPYNFNIVTTRYSRSAEITPARGCNSFTVTNLGDTPVDFNGEILFPSATPLTAVGDSVSFGSNLGEVYKGNMTLKFALPLGATPLVAITQKYYTAFQ